MNTKIFLAATGTSLSRAESVNGSWQVTFPLDGIQINCLVATAQRVYAGTQTEGMLVSEDSGKTWKNGGLRRIPVKSLAVHPWQPDTIFAGVKPVSLYVSGNGGESWEELPSLRRARKWWWFSPAEPPDWGAYVQALTISPANPNVIMAGIELGGVLRSEDGGKSWSKHRKGAVLDCHSLMFHPTYGDWVYEGGGSGVGAAFSQDGGKTWKQPKEGLGKKYGWMVAADPARPEVWYLSASQMPNPLRGEFVPQAHVDGDARAHIYRSNGGMSWEKLSGGLPNPLDHMAYALVPDPSAPSHLYAGLANGDVWHTTNCGDSWTRMLFNLKGIHQALIIL
jgi:hypothetical protein